MVIRLYKFPVSKGQRYKLMVLNITQLLRLTTWEMNKRIDILFLTTLEEEEEIYEEDDSPRIRLK
jgi:hypothetical protein